MENNFLQKGDVISIKNGTKIYTQIPEMFVLSNRLTSKKLTHSTVTIGKIYNNITDISKSLEKVANGIIERFGWEGFDISFEDAIGFVKSKVKIPNNESFKIDEGDFVVIDVSFDGGGTGHGPNDIYPDGYHVFCKKLKDGVFDENGTEINFYQSGSFTAMITDIKPKSKMKIIYEKV